MPSQLPVTIDDVWSAHEAILGAVVRTPVNHSRTLSAITGAEVWIKFENLQYTGSFKERGALNRLLTLSEGERARGVVAVSAGNHAQAVAHHATELGIESTVLMPVNTPVNKVSRTEENGARVVLEGTTLTESQEIARSLAERDGSVFIAPYDDPLVVAGQGTCAVELIEDGPPFDALVVPVGGGGLFAGTCLAAQTLAPDVELIGVQSELYPSMVVATGRSAPSDPDPAWGPTIAEGIAVKRPGEITTQIIAALADDVVVVSEHAIEEAVLAYLEIEKVVAEGAGAAPLALLLSERERFAGRRVGLILSGANIDSRLLASVIMRGLGRTGRLCRLVIEISDLPGALAELTAAIGEAGGNIVDLTHHREFGVHSARVTEIELLIETRDAAHGHAVRAALEATGYVVQDSLQRID